MSEKMLKQLNTEIIKLLPETARTKINNITEKASTDLICPAPRVNASSRLTIPYEVVKQNNISLENLKTIENGVVIVLENEDYLNIKDKDEILEKYLIENIGGDNNVSAILGFYNTNGTSSSAKERIIYEKMKPIIAEKGWRPLQRKPNFNIPRGQTYIGNDNWEGEYFAYIAGGDNKEETIKTHDPKKVEHQLFNSYNKGYMDRDVGIHTTSSLLYFLLFSDGISNLIPLPKVNEYKERYSNLFKQINYDEGNLYDYCHCPIKKIIVNGVLQCPLDYSSININQFMIKDQKDQKYLQICHNEAASKKKVYFDEKQKVFLTDYRPTNVFWGTYQGNMEQQTFTIEEYKKHIINKAERMRS